MFFVFLAEPILGHLGVFFQVQLRTEEYPW